MIRPIALVLLIACTVPTPTRAAEAPPLAAQYQETAARLIGSALVDREGWRKLEHLCDRIGHRLTGSPQLEEAVRWAAEQMRQDGLAHVRLQPVTAPHWVRGRESLTMRTPRERPLSMLGLGHSIGTSPEGITAAVVPVRSFDELEALGEAAVAGKIVLYDVPFTRYGETVQYRVHGASRAARLGAVAALVRSVGPVSLRSPHTGGMRYADDAPRIPAAAVAVEDAEQIHRLVRAGQTVTVRLTMEAQMLPDTQTHNVMGEIEGRERPEEVVVMGGHIDSWDVGQGAHDDGAACVAAMQALALIKSLGLRPRRTLRVVLWTNEENGIRGAKTYRAELGGAIGNHVAAIEMDSGCERPIGFGLGLPWVDEAEAATREAAYAPALATLREIATLLAGIGADTITTGGGGADIGPLMKDGVPGLGLKTVGERYFHWHHTHADTLDKVDPDDFRRAMATLAVMGYVLADMPGRLVEE